MELDAPPLPPPTAGPGGRPHHGGADRAEHRPDGRPPGSIIGGVCATFAARMGLDPLWVRIAFVVLALTGGIGILVYVGAWLVFVLGPAQDSRLVRVLGGAVLIAVVPLVIDDGTLRFASGPVAVIGLLGGLALALWHSQRPQTATASSQAIWPAVDVPADPGSVMPRVEHQHREPSLLGRAAFGLAIVVAATGALIDQGNGGRLHPEQWLGAAAGVCGLGLLVGAFRGRSRWLVLPAVAFAGVGFVSGELARFGIDADHLRGDQHFSIDTGEARGVREHRIESGFGDAYVDVQSPPAAAHRVIARMAFGGLTISAPDDMPIEIRARFDRGHVVANGSRRDGDVVHVGPEGSPLLIVDARIGIGDVTVYQFVHDENGGAADAEPGQTTLVPFPNDLQVGQLTEVGPYISGTADGYIVLNGGEVVIDPDDQVVSSVYPPYPMADGGVANGLAIDTGMGQFRLLPRSLLLTPELQVIDLRAIRAELANQALPAPSAPGSNPPPLISVPADPNTPGTIAPIPPIPTRIEENQG